MSRKKGSRLCGCTNPQCDCDDLECMNYSCSDKCNCKFSQELNKSLFFDDYYLFNSSEEDEENKKVK